MLLIIDIGNSNVVGCLYNESKPFGNDCEFLEIMRVPTNKTQDYYQWLNTINYNISPYFDCFEKIIISSVVPELNNHFSKALKKLYSKDIYWINCNIYPKLPIQIAQPRIIGSDLVANAMAGYKKAPEGCIVLDFGTVLTFTTVYDKAIKSINFVPGLKTALKSLYNNTAQLPEIEIGSPKTIFAKNTEEAMQSGLVFGFSGLVDRIIEQIKKESGKDNLRLFSTGGLGNVLTPYCKQKLEYNIKHTIYGIKLISDYFE
ncbi:MAG: type III pantothenate kinase [Bacteroidales bacterium]|jgi:type III pantothenate kinase